MKVNAYEVETWDANVHLEVTTGSDGVTIIVYQRREHDDVETPIHLSLTQAAQLIAALCDPARLVGTG